MPSDYEQICKDNIRRRGEEFDDIGRLISEQLYSDRTHFIYELLQNAEDALDRRHGNNPENRLPDSVKFILYKDRLEFRHFGEKFNTDDVKGISDVLKGTKAEDRSQIGRFGIGFKSVYAFTSTPEIHSGDEHFVIERYIRPRSIDKFCKMTEGETVFIFPFNHENLSAEQAFHLIEEKLKKIGSRVLLFLKKISEIEWIIDGQYEGQYLKEPKPYGKSVQKVTVIGQQGNKDEEEEEWLVFDRHIESDNSHREEVIEIAFRLKEDEKSKKQRIAKIEFSPLNVYFPTKLETRLGFLVQGSYDTTASRSDIEENDWNKRLIEETAFLLTETVLPILKKMGLLTVSFLEALPIKPEDFPQNSVFRPIYNKIRATLRHQDFLPTAGDEHVAGKYAVLARAEDLVHLLNSKQLSFLLNNSQKSEWLTTEITETRKNIHRYLVGWKPRYLETGEEIEPLIVAEIRPENMIEKLTPVFLKEQSITWLLKLYAFFEKRSALIDELSNKPIIRLKNGTHVSPFKEDGSPNAYLPPEDDTEFPVVTSEITKDEKALEFLKKLRLTEPDAVDEVIGIIPKYTQDHPLISDDKHMRDIKKILHAYSTDSQEKKKHLVSKLKETAFIRTENLVSKQVEYKKPGQLYFRNEDLLLYFDGNKDVWFVSSEYDACFYDMFKDIGAADVVNVKRKTLEWNRHVVIASSHGRHKRGLNGFDPDIVVDGLEYALTHPTIEKSLFIWNRIAIANADCICGIVESSSRQTYENSHTEEKTSKFGKLLMGTAWLPMSSFVQEGNSYKPSELKLDDLPELFERNETLAGQLGMKKDEIKRIEEKMGGKFVPKEEYEEFKKWQKEKPAFPEKASLNAERREKKIIEKYRKAPKKRYEKKGLSKKTTENTIDPRTWLMENYTNKKGELICQICKKKTFKKRNGKYYFEAIELLNNIDREMEELHIALCPLCAAMYNEFVKQDEVAMECLKGALITANDLELPINLDDKEASLRFVETHINDLKVILRELGDNID